MTNFETKKNNAGFTMVELVLYLALSAIVVLAGTVFVLDIIDKQNKALAYQEVQQNARFALEKMSQAIRSASSTDIMIGQLGTYRADNSTGNLADHWLDSDYTYRKRIRIKGNAQATTTGYTIPIRVRKGNNPSSTTATTTVYLGAGKYSQSLFDNIRFTAGDGITPLDQWREEISGPSYNPDAAVFWVKMNQPMDYSRLIYVYYSDAAPPYSGRGEDVFLFFDHFDDAITSDAFKAKWEDYYLTHCDWGCPHSNSVASTSGSMLKLNFPAQYNTKEKFNVPVAYKMRVQVGSSIASNQAVVVFPMDLYFTFYPFDQNVLPDYAFSKIRVDNTKRASQNSVGWSIDTWYDWNAMATNTMSFVRDGSLNSFFDANGFTVDEINSLNTPSNLMIDEGGQSKIDWILVRKYTWPDLAVDGYYETFAPAAAVESQDPVAPELILDPNMAAPPYKFKVEGGILKMSVNNGTYSPITSNQVEVKDLEIIGLGYPYFNNGRGRALKINLTLKRKNPLNLSAFDAEATLSTTINLDEN